METSNKTELGWFENIAVRYYLVSSLLFVYQTKRKEFQKKFQNLSKNKMEQILGQRIDHHQNGDPIPSTSLYGNTSDDSFYLKTPRTQKNKASEELAEIRDFNEQSSMMEFRWKIIQFFALPPRRWALQCVKDARQQPVSIRYSLGIPFLFFDYVYFFLERAFYYLDRFVVCIVCKLCCATLNGLIDGCLKEQENKFGKGFVQKCGNLFSDVKTKFKSELFENESFFDEEQIKNDLNRYPSINLIVKALHDNGSEFSFCSAFGVFIMLILIFCVYVFSQLWRMSYFLILASLYAVVILFGVISNLPSYIYQMLGLGSEPLERVLLKLSFKKKETSVDRSVTHVLLEKKYIDKFLHFKRKKVWDVKRQKNDKRVKVQFFEKDGQTVCQIVSEYYKLLGWYRTIESGVYTKIVSSDEFSTPSGSNVYEYFKYNALEEVSKLSALEEVGSSAEDDSSDDGQVFVFKV